MDQTYTGPNYQRAAVIVIDFQNDCILPGAAFEVSGSFDVFPALQKLVKGAREANVPILHVVRAYLPDGSNVDLCRRELVQKGQALFAPYTFGADFPAELKPEGAADIDWDALLQGSFQQIGSSDWVMYKSRWGAFYRTGLEEFLRERGIDTLIFGGCNFPNCPRTSIYEASERDFRIVLARDALSGIYDQGLQELRNIGVTVSDAEEICTQLKQSL